MGVSEGGVSHLVQVEDALLELELARLDLKRQGVGGGAGEGWLERGGKAGGQVCTGVGGARGCKGFQKVGDVTAVPLRCRGCH